MYLASPRERAKFRVSPHTFCAYLLTYNKILNIRQKHWLIPKWYIPLTNLIFSVRTVSYGPSFFSLRLMARARSARAINRRGKTRIRKYEVSKIFIISLLCVWRVRERFPFTRNGGEKSRNSLATKRTLNFSGPCKRVRPAKLTNHSARTNSVRHIKSEDIIAIWINKKLMKKGSSCWGRKTAWRVQEVSVKEDNNRNVQRRGKATNRENQDKNIRTVFYHSLSILYWKFSF